ncbi:MAG TPA: DUF4271 domain-containing protein [Cyclobacteriaceae bacterium]|nr:DUF4271 domain-containing protein [Cyclobacteriaceae bacterium]
MIRLLFFLVIVIVQVSDAAPGKVVKDLRSEWMKYDGGAYHFVDVSAPDILNTIYFSLDTTLYKGQYLSVSSIENWDLYVNGKLICSGQVKLFPVDSLSQLYSPLFFAVHSSVAIQELKTQIISGHAGYVSNVREITLKPPTFFRDYAILACAILFIFLLVLFKTNPQLTLDYFSFAKIFSVRERNENLLVTRITSSVNLLFYLFCALLTGFLLSAVFYFAGNFFRVARGTEIISMGSAFWLWARLSAYILMLLAAKLIIVLLFSSLFNFRETVSFQFFNFLRFVLFTAVMMALLSLLYFVFRGGQAQFYALLISLALIFLSAGSVMVLIKLLARAPFSFFHLFSYLCASEIIPLVIIIKIFF